MNVFLFAGQSSKYPTMFAWLEQHHADVFSDVAARARAIVGEDWWPASHDGSFPTNRSVQLAVFVANHMHLRVLASVGIGAECSAGLSLGEYNHLVHIGALSFEDGLRLVDARGRAYDDGPRGCMAAVFPIEEDELAPIVEELAAAHPLAISNYNSPQQLVVAGSSEGIAALIERVERDTFAEARIIEHDVPMHSPLFRPAATALRAALDRTAFQDAELPYVPNVAPAFVESPTPATLVQYLARHVYEPVRFRETIDLFMAQVPEPTFIEVGPREVIKNMLNRRWCKHPTFSTHDQDAITELTESLNR